MGPPVVLSPQRRQPYGTRVPLAVVVVVVVVVDVVDGVGVGGGGVAEILLFRDALAVR